MALTEKQTQALVLKKEGYTQMQTAEAMGISRWAVRNLLDRAGDQGGDIDQATQEVMDHFGLDRPPDRFWAKDRKFSALVVPKKQADQDFIESLQVAFLNIPAAPVIQAPEITNDQLMTVYPLFDVHLDLLAAASISGETTNIEIATERLKKNLATVMANSPNSKKGVIINGGDFSHTDDDQNVTPKHKHPLDSSARNYTTVDGSIELLCALIEMGLEKHETVDYYSVPGNHDPKNWMAVMMALYNRYRDNPRVHIEKNPLEFSIITFGDTLLVVHHGDKRKVKDLILFFAAEFPDVFAAAKHRMVFTGHNHHLKAEDFPGWEWRQFRPITSRDHHAYSNFYSSMSEVLSIVFHENEGEKTGWKEKL